MSCINSKVIDISDLDHMENRDYREYTLVNKQTNFPIVAGSDLHAKSPALPLQVMSKNYTITCINHFHLQFFSIANKLWSVMKPHFQNYSHIQ